jgi:hypothetical protein
MSTPLVDIGGLSCIYTKQRGKCTYHQGEIGGGCVVGWKRNDRTCCTSWRGEVEVIAIMKKGRRRSGEAALCLGIPL